MQVQVSLDENGLFDLMYPKSATGELGPVHSIRVPGNGAASVYYPLRMTSLGNVPVRVTAVSELAADAVIRDVYVRVSSIWLGLVTLHPNITVEKFCA